MTIPKFDPGTFVTKIQEALNHHQIDQTKPSEALDLGIQLLNTLAYGTVRGFSCQSNRIARGFARA